MSPFEQDMTTVPYTRGYYRALSPTMITTAMEIAGVRAPDLRSPLNYCELGMGFGVSLVAHAACFPHLRFFGNDFNPDQVRYARTLADDAGLDNLHLMEDGFDELLSRDLPPMDFIVMQGIYSWVSPRLRQVILTFIERHLQPGGVVYVSHNTLPGWSAMMPLRELMRLHAWSMAPDAGSQDSHARQALAFLAGMQQRGAAYLSATPGVPGRLAELAEAHPSYISHEYFNPDWHPMYVHAVAADMANAGLTRVASAHLEDHVDGAWLTGDAQRHLSTLGDAVLRETLRDYYLNQVFRRDLYARGAPVLTGWEHEARLLGRHWALVTPRDDLPAQALQGPGGTLIEAAEYARVLDGLTDGPVALRHLLRNPGIAAMGQERLLQALLMLSGHGHVQPALPEPLRKMAQPGVDRFNAVSLARGAADGLHQVVSAATGQATGWTPLAMMQMRIYLEGIDEAASMAHTMKSQLDHAPPASQPRPEARQFNRLAKGATRFLRDEVPVLQQLGVL